MPEINNIPDELLNTNHFENDVSVLVGENGSGKSTLLNALSKHYLKRGKNVIALANSVHDKFDRGHRKFHTLSGRSGRRQTRSTIKNALENIGDDNIQQLKNAARALSYVGFYPMIGFKVDKLSLSYRELLSNSQLNNEEKDEIIYLIEQTLRESKQQEIIWLEMETFSFTEIEKSSLTKLFKWERVLKTLKVISRIEVFLRKGGNNISMLDASSGELALITSIVYISTIITEQTVVLIDEPENSLHPKWQKEYSKIIMDIFYLFQPKIIIATHSPLVVNGTELFISTTKVYKAQGFTFEIQHKEPLNVEELIYRFFDLSTPQNRFLSDLIVRYLNLLANEKISLETFENEISKIQSKSYDDKQLDFLTSIKQFAGEIVSGNSQ